MVGFGCRFGADRKDALRRFWREHPAIRQSLRHVADDGRRGSLCKGERSGKDHHNSRRRNPGGKPATAKQGRHQHPSQKAQRANGQKCRIVAAQAFGDVGGHHFGNLLRKGRADHRPCPLWRRGSSEWFGDGQCRGQKIDVFAR